MKVLLLGEYSNVHWTLAQGLRALGHSVTVASDGDSWKTIRVTLICIGSRQEKQTRWISFSAWLGLSLS